MGEGWKWRGDEHGEGEGEKWRKKIMILDSEICVFKGIAFFFSSVQSLSRVRLFATP